MVKTVGDLGLNYVWYLGRHHETKINLCRNFQLGSRYLCPEKPPWMFQKKTSSKHDFYREIRAISINKHIPQPPKKSGGVYSPNSPTKICRISMGFPFAGPPFSHKLMANEFKPIPWPSELSESFQLALPDRVGRIVDVMVKSR